MWEVFFGVFGLWCFFVYFCVYEFVYIFTLKIFHHFMRQQNQALFLEHLW